MEIYAVLAVGTNQVVHVLLEYCLYEPRTDSIEARRTSFLNSL
jgi:hypothetical protein